MKLTDTPPTPKYWQLAEQLKLKMEQGILKPGDRLPSLTEMREHHDASRPTVEKAHRLLEQEGLIERLHGAGVFVSAPRKKSTHGVIGLSGRGFCFNGYSAYWAQLMGGVRDAASKAGAQLLMLDADSYNGWEKADGVLVCDWNDSHAPRRRPPGQPLVSLMAAVEGMASVVADDEAGALAATEHLIEAGHQRIAYLHGNQQVLLENRLHGYRKALKAAGIRPLKAWTHRMHGFYDVGAQITEESRKAMRAWLRDGWKESGCTALLCHNDEAAWGAIQALNEAGLEVPKDVSVIGFDGTEFCDLISPRLSTVELPLREIGALGVELLLRQIEADEVSKEHRVLAAQLRVRESTSIPRIVEKSY